MKKLEADVVVIAAGASGLSAAIAAAEKDASVIVFEKGSTTGGAANMGMGFFAAGSRHQKRMMIDFYPDDAFDRIMEFNHMRVDANLVRKYVDISASTIEWIENMGVEFMGAYKYFEKSEATWHIVKLPGSNKLAERSASYMFKLMTEYAKEQGVQFLFNTPATKLLMDHGRVVGVQGVDADGEIVEVECDAAIICTGGFGNNAEMIQEETGFTWGKDLFSWQIPGLNGDGLKMAWEVGAGKSRTMMELTYTCPELTNLYKTLQETMRQPNLMVNIKGERYMNEGYKMNTPYSGNALCMQPEKTAFSIISDEIVDYYRHHGLDFVAYHFAVYDVDNWDSELENWRHGTGQATDGLADLRRTMSDITKCFWEAASIEELAELTGIDYGQLQKTIDEYNEMCDRGVDKKFNKESKYMLPIRGKKFYAAKYFPSAYGTMGGIKCNHNLEVLTEDFEKIPGLYVAGMEANTLHADTYLFYLPGSTMGFAINSGRMAGYNAVDYLDSDDFVE